MRVAVVYRVVQSWRAPVFERLANKYDVKVFYGCDFPGTKVVSLPSPHKFRSKKMFSLPIALKKSTGNMLVPFSPFLFADLVRFKPDVVVCEGASNFLNNITVFIYCKLFNKKIVQWGLGEIAGRAESRVRKLLNPLIQPIERRSNAIICYSTSGTNYYKKIGVSEEKIFVAVNVIDTDQRLKEISNYSPSKNRIKTDVFRILFVGALEQNKKVDVLLRVVSRLRLKYKNVELHIIGDGHSKPNLKKLCKDLSIESVTFFYGRVDGPLVHIIDGMDVFIMPGLGGLAISDMLCHGIPVICGTGDGCEGDLLNGKNGKVLDDLNDEALLKEVSMLIEDPKLLSSMKFEAKKTIQRYNIKSYLYSISQAIEYSQDN